jgi:hypothetical protein
MYTRKNWVDSFQRKKNSVAPRPATMPIGTATTAQWARSREAVDHPPWLAARRAFQVRLGHVL